MKANIDTDNSAGCSIWQSDIAAYVSLIIDARADEADRRYPDLIVHLLSCPYCAEEYQLLMTFEEVISSATLLPFLHNSSLRRVLFRPVQQFTVQRAITHKLLRSETSWLGHPRGDITSTIVIGVEELDRTIFSISARRANEKEWFIMLTSDSPPVSFPATLVIGSVVFTGEHQIDGSVLFVAVPNELLTSAEGPNILILSETTTL